jgi:hypothetical protein
MSGLPLLLFSFLIGFAVVAVGSLRKAQKGRRLDYIRSHAFDVSMDALLAAITSLPIGAILGCIFALVAIHIFGVHFESPIKYRIVFITCCITYICICTRFIRKGC